MADKTPRLRDKALREEGLAALCGYLRAVNATAEQSSSAVANLGVLLDQSLQEVEDALNDFPRSTPVTISAAGWQREDAAEGDGEIEATLYPYYYDIPAENIDATDRASVTVLPESYTVAVACGLCPANETLDPSEDATEGQPKIGAIRIRAARAPTDSIEVEYWIEKGKE